MLFFVVVHRTHSVIIIFDVAFFVVVASWDFWHFVLCNTSSIGMKMRLMHSFNVRRRESLFRIVMGGAIDFLLYFNRKLINKIFMKCEWKINSCSLRYRAFLTGIAGVKDHLLRHLGWPMNFFCSSSSFSLQLLTVWSIFGKK